MPSSSSADFDGAQDDSCKVGALLTHVQILEQPALEPFYIAVGFSP
jgi:hypothetical protein